MNNPTFTIAHCTEDDSSEHYYGHLWRLDVTGGTVGEGKTRCVARLESEELACEVRFYLFSMGFYHE